MSPIYEAIQLLISQLSDAEQDALLNHLQQRQPQRLTPEAWEALHQTLIMDTPLVGEFSNRREDWYGDDGR